MSSATQRRRKRRGARHVSDVPTVLIRADPSWNWSPPPPPRTTQTQEAGCAGKGPSSRAEAQRSTSRGPRLCSSIPAQTAFAAGGSQLRARLVNLACSQGWIPSARHGRSFRASRSGGESVDKPGSVASNHSSRAAVADCLVRPTRDRRGPRHRPPIWPCSRRECLAGPVARTRGALLPHPFTLAGRANGWRSALCCTCRRLAPPRDYLAPCPVEPGLSSSRPVPRTFRPNAGRRRAVA